MENVERCDFPLPGGPDIERICGVRVEIHPRNVDSSSSQVADPLSKCEDFLV